MSTTRLDEIAIFLVTNLFTSKLNALGISNLPTAISSVRAAFKDDKKKEKGRLIYVAGIFNSLVVVSGLTGRWPYLIKTNAVANILNGVKESITARKTAESALTEEEVNQEAQRKRSIISDFFKNRFFPSHKDSDIPASKGEGDESTDDSNSNKPSVTRETDSTDTQTPKAQDSSSSSSLKNRFFSSHKSSTDQVSKSNSSSQDEDVVEKRRRKKTVAKAQALLAGKRESSMDDIIWGVFQIALVFFDVGRWRAIGHAWMVFLLHVLEETYLNDKLTRKQKMRKFAYLTIAAYFSGRLVYK